MIASQTCCIGNDGSHMRCQTRNQMILRDSQRGRWAPLVDYEPAWDESSGYERATEAPSRTINQVFACVVSVLPREARSEEHTSELQSHHDLVCRLLLE